MLKTLLKQTLLCFFLIALTNLYTATGAQSQMTPTLPTKFELKKSGLEIERRTQLGTFFDVVGRKAAVAGYENRAFETWIYPLKILDDFQLAFHIEGYPLDIQGADTAVSVSVRPEATTFTYSHAAFTVRQIIYAPIEEQGIIMLLDVRSALPITIKASFRPRLRLMWPAGLMTGNLSWDEKRKLYFITEETHRFAGVIGSPAAQDVSVMPYQEEPRDVPAQFVVNAPAEELKTHYIPIVIAGSTEGSAKARETYERLLGSAQALYESNVAYYENLEKSTLKIETPDERLNAAFAWAKVGVDKGFATNPYLGTGLLAGFRTSGESERPGFAWFFGRDALWTSLAINSYGDFAKTRAALEFLKKFQREDGKIPHEISQSASLLPWFKEYEYPWASADATPLYVIACADYWHSTGDESFLKANWESIVKAYKFTAATDTDGNGLVENTKFGHGWVEGGALYPPHEEIYMQGLWIEASGQMAELADLMHNEELAKLARKNEEKTIAAVEKTYWLKDEGYYAFATSLPRKEPVEADPGPNRAQRQERMNELAGKHLIDEDTVLPAVPLWFHALLEERAQSEIDHLGSAAMATDWGTRIISEQSSLYDPLSYHYGSVWPLFTGWAAMGAYSYSRPHVGFQALMANSLLTFSGASGYVTELLSGDFNSPFGRSSHHQIWSEAMVISPLVRGLLGIEVSEGGRSLRFAPQLPANWNQISATHIAVGNSFFDISLKRETGRETIKISRSNNPTNSKEEMNRDVHLNIAPAFPLDAQVRGVTVNGRNMKFEIERIGDVQHAEIFFDYSQESLEIVYDYVEGTDVSVETASLQPGARSEALRILRSHADSDELRLVVEGRAGHIYSLRIHTPRSFDENEELMLPVAGSSDYILTLEFEGDEGGFERREITIPFLPSSK